MTNENAREMGYSQTQYGRKMVSSQNKKFAKWDINMGFHKMGMSRFILI
jgi:hypothetical protein